jgi:hypothetical protein
MEQLADEMQESEVCPFPGTSRNYGWAAARAFYAKEIRAICKMRKAPKNEASQ